MANSTSGTESGQSAHRQPAKERRTSAIAAMTPLTRSTLPVALCLEGEEGGFGSEGDAASKTARGHPRPEE